MTVGRIDELAFSLARRQLGLFTAGQLLRRGGTRASIDRRVRGGRWEVLHKGVYRIAGGAPLGDEQRLLAACWAGGERSVVSHRAAAGLWALPGAAAVVEITAPRWRRARHDDVIGHESRHLAADDDVTTIGLLPVTRPARTILDLAAVVAPPVVEQALDEAVRRGLVDVVVLWRRWEALGGVLRPGGRVVEHVLDRWRAPLRPVESRAEAVLLRRLRGAALPEPEPQHRVRIGPDEVVRLDFAWPDLFVGLEFDSYRYHGGRLRHDRDARRRARLRTVGWEVLVVTDGELDGGLPTILPALRAALGGRASRARPVASNDRA